MSLPGKTALIRACYPEGNFERNQLLEDSISLSPLCPCSTNDLHVSIATTFHRNFFRLQPTQVKFIFFRVLPMHLLFPQGASPKRERNCGQRLAPDRFPMLSLRLRVCYALRLGTPVNSLVRVSRRDNRLRQSLRSVVSFHALEPPLNPGTTSSPGT